MFDALVFAFLLGAEDAYLLARRLLCQRANYPKEMYYSLMNLMGSHDRSRIINILGQCDDQSIPRPQQRLVRMSREQYARGKARLKQMLRAVCALPGMPCVLYGDEAGLQGMRDPFCRGFFPWGREDLELTAFFREQMQRRRNMPVLQTGLVRIRALDKDRLEIERYFENGRDAFGAPADAARETVVIDRTGL